MIMTAELNSHQRVSYYTGVKLIRHHQSASSANPNNTNNNSSSNSTSNTTTNNNNNSSNNNNNSATKSTTQSGYYHQHPNHYPPHPPPHHLPPHHHPHQQQHPPPPLPPHHPGHFHLPCPTGPPHIQHPGGVIHLNHHGPPHHPQHHNGPHHYGGGGTNQTTTRLYTGSPLIRSTGYHSSSSVPGGTGGGLGGNKRSYKGNHQRGHHNNNNHHNHHINNRNVGISNHHHHHHHHHQNIIGGSCSSGTSSSSSSNEHLNNLQSPTSSPITQTKLDISPLKLSSTSVLNRETSSSSSSNNSSPGPQGPPSPSTSSNLSSSSSPNSADGNKDLDHFYFLDEHWKPSSDVGGNGTGHGMIPTDMMDIGNSNNGPLWTSSSSGSPSPPTVSPVANVATLPMMVDQFFANGINNNNNFGMVDGNNNNFIGINGDGMGEGLLLRDSNNNIIGGPQPNLNERHPPPNDHFHNSFSGFKSGNNNLSVIGNDGASSAGLFNFGPGAKFTGINNNNSSSMAVPTVVNVETQIGTFNGQRDLEIRLCFIKGDHHNKTHHGGGLVFGENHQPQVCTQYPEALRIENSKTITAIGDPFRSSVKSMAARTERAAMMLQSSESSSSASSSSASDNEMDNKVEAIGMPIPKNKEIIQQS